MPVVSRNDDHTATSVCIIGAGISGVLAIKSCLEENLQVTCYEKSNAYGGLWKYREDYNEDFVATVMKTTILNTSKELSAFSDYPPPEQYPNYMPHSLFMEYMENYVDHFNLKQHIVLNSPVKKCQPKIQLDNCKISWLVTVEDRSTNKMFTRTFDKLIIAIGHHALPYKPTFLNQQQFNGQIIHTHELKDPIHDNRFKDKNICVVGIGNSACDSAVDISVISKKCYLSSHRGNWFVSRIDTNGPYDLNLKTRWKLYLQKWFLTSKYINESHKRHIEQRWPHHLLGIQPKHEPNEHPPNVNDYIAQRIVSGCIEMRNGIERFTKNGVVFRGHKVDQETPLDMVVLGTGYKVELPFFYNEANYMGLRSQETNELLLYLNIYAPQLNLNYIDYLDGTTVTLKLDKNQHQHLHHQLISSLAFVGFIQPGGSIFVCSEMQSRHVALVFSGKLKLEKDVGKMMEHIVRGSSKKQRSIRSQTREFTVDNWIGYLDELAEQIGVKPNMLSMFFSDFTLWRHLTFGPSVPYQYRLNGPHNWHNARSIILDVPHRIEQGLNGGENNILYKYRQRKLSTGGHNGDNNATTNKLKASSSFLSSCTKSGGDSCSSTIWAIFKEKILGSSRNNNNRHEDSRYSLVAPTLYVSLLATSSVAATIYMLLHQTS